MLHPISLARSTTADRVTAADWLAYFQQNHSQLLPINWQQTGGFTPQEQKRFRQSIAIFQLGESSEGHRLMRTVRAWVAQGADPVWVDVFKWFVREEQRHAADLGRLLDREQLPRLRHHWADAAFRWLRGGMNWELALAMLLTAEVMGLLYARALQGATDHPIAQAVAWQIEWDESQHLQMQGQLLAQLRRGRSPLHQKLTHVAHRWFLTLTLGAVWLDHRPVFRAAGWTFRSFAQAARAELNQAIDPRPLAMPRPILHPLSRQQRSRSQDD